MNSNSPHTRESIVEAIRTCAANIGESPSRASFVGHSGITEYHVLLHFPNWTEAVIAAGLSPDTSNLRIEDDQLLADWGMVVRKCRQIPTRHKYRSEGKYSVSVFGKRFGPWSSLPQVFRTFAEARPEWQDVCALLPIASAQWTHAKNPQRKWRRKSVESCIWSITPPATCLVAWLTRWRESFRRRPSERTDLLCSLRLLAWSMRRRRKPFNGRNEADIVFCRAAFFPSGTRFQCVARAATGTVF